MTLARYITRRDRNHLRGGDGQKRVVLEWRTRTISSRTIAIQPLGTVHVGKILMCTACLDRPASGVSITTATIFDTGQASESADGPICIFILYNQGGGGILFSISLLCTWIHDGWSDRPIRAVHQQSQSDFKTRIYLKKKINKIRRK